jgi:hypothetical protein
MPIILIFAGAWQRRQLLTCNRLASSGENIRHKISYLYYFLLVDFG